LSGYRAAADDLPAEPRRRSPTAYYWPSARIYSPLPARLFAAKPAAQKPSQPIKKSADDEPTENHPFPPLGG